MNSLEIFYGFKIACSTWIGISAETQQKFNKILLIKFYEFP